MQTVELWFHSVELNEDGKIDPMAIEVFTEGHCHSLALAIHEMTGWPLAGFGSDRESPAHTVVFCPPLGDYVDILGTGAYSRWRNFDLHIYDSKEDVLNFTFYKKPNLEMARPFARTVLEHLPVEVLPKAAAAGA